MQPSRNSRPHQPTRPGKPARVSRRPRAFTRVRAVPPGYARRRQAEARRQPTRCRAAKPSAMDRGPKLTTPWFAPRLTEAIRGSNPSHLHVHFGEPKRSKEMTCGTALVACHSLASERSAEIAVAARMPLRGETHRGLSTRRARPTRHETPRLPRRRCAVDRKRPAVGPDLRRFRQHRATTRAAASSRQLSPSTNRWGDHVSPTAPTA